MADGSSNSFHGRCLSPGMADGPILVQDHFDDGFQGGDVPRPDTPIVSRQVDAEHSLLDHAVEQVTEDLLQLAAKVEREISAPLGQVFDAHRLIANDDSLRTEMRREITENLVGAGTAVRIVFGRWEERLLQMKSNISKSKSDDMADVSRRLRDALGRVLHPALAGIPSGCVLIRNRLLPSDTIILSDHLPAAIILDHGSHGSHAALFVREMDLPCIVGCAGLRERVGAHRGIHALVDADVGVVSVAPDPSSCERFQRKQRRNDLLRRRSILRAQAPAITIDGTHVKVMANVGSVKDAKSAAKSGADGIGLLRVEQLYLGRLSPPDVDELVAVLRPILEPFRGMPTCVRLLDAGADKQLPFLRIHAEANPALGLRGIRLLRAYPQLLDTGIRALVKLSQDFPLSILIPMVTVAEDITSVTDVLKRICAGWSGPLPKVGAMIETPAAALMIDTLKEHLDFFSFGTNDLTQYCFAADREGVAVEAYFLDGHEAIFRLMRSTIQAAPELPASLCGELAGSTKDIDTLVAIGLRCLSVAPPAVAKTKAAIRQVERSSHPAMG